MATIAYISPIQIVRLPESRCNRNARSSLFNNKTKTETETGRIGESKQLVRNGLLAWILSSGEHTDLVNCKQSSRIRLANQSNCIGGCNCCLHVVLVAGSSRLWSNWIGYYSIQSSRAGWLLAVRRSTNKPEAALSSLCVHLRPAWAQLFPIDSN